VEYYFDLLLRSYKAQLLISPPTAEGYTVRARRKASDEWATATHELLGVALYEVCNLLYEADRKLIKPLIA
jgi:predicted ATPase